MGWSGAAAATVAAVVGLGLVLLARIDARTGQIPVAPARQLTALSLAGLGLIGLASADWIALAGAGLGAVLVTGIQLVPYLLQRRTGRAAIGRADVRLGLPFGWVLGWFGVSFAVIGFLAALLTGLVASTVLRRGRIPFVPFLAVGYWLALLWAAAVALT